jgi:hypothetical protein
MNDGADRRCCDDLAFQILHAPEHRIGANDHMRARIVLGLDGLAGNRDNIDTASHGLDEVRRSRRCEVKLAAKRTRQDGKILRNGQRNVETIPFEKAFILGDPRR